MASVFDLHIHTTQGSPDSGLTPEQLTAEAERIGLTGTMVTEHVGWPRQEFEQFAFRQKIVLVRALELYTPLGHMIALGMDRQVTGYNGGIETVRQLRREVDRIGGFLILAHPFRFLFDLPGRYSQNILFPDPGDSPPRAAFAATHPVFEIVDEVEVVNGGNTEPENRFAQDVVRILGKYGTGGSDAHSINGLGKGTTGFKGDIRNEVDLLEALRAGDFFPVEGFHIGRPKPYGRQPSDLTL